MEAQAGGTAQLSSPTFRATNSCSVSGSWDRGVTAHVGTVLTGDGAPTVGTLVGIRFWGWFGDISGAHWEP